MRLENIKKASDIAYRIDCLDKFLSREMENCRLTITTATGLKYELTECYSGKVKKILKDIRIELCNAFKRLDNE